MGFHDLRLDLRLEDLRVDSNNNSEGGSRDLLLELLDPPSLGHKLSSYFLTSD